MTDKVQAQGLLDAFQLFDSETVGKVKDLLKAIDSDKVKKIMDAVNVEDGKIKVNLEIVFEKS